MLEKAFVDLGKRKAEFDYKILMFAGFLYRGSSREASRMSLETLNSVVSYTPNRSQTPNSEVSTQ